MAETDLAARVSFVSTLESGYARTIRKGAVFAADHPVVVANPTRFGPVNVRERPGTAASAALRQAATRPAPVVDDPAPSPVERIAELVKASRSELDDLAKAAGVKDPQDLPNKGAVAEAILAAVAPEPAVPIVGGLEGGAGRPASVPRDAPTELADATDQELAAIAHEYGIDVVEDDREATIRAIKGSAGYGVPAPADGMGEFSGAPAPETPLSADAGKSDATGAKAGSSSKGAGAATGAKAGSSSQ